MPSKKKKAKNRYWAWGEQRLLAYLSGQTEARVSMILRRQLRPGIVTARKLHVAALKLGKVIPVEAWTGTQDHEAFSV